METRTDNNHSTPTIRRPPLRRDCPLFLSRSAPRAPFPRPTCTDIFLLSLSLCFIFLRRYLSSLLKRTAEISYARRRHDDKCSRSPAPAASRRNSVTSRATHFFHHRRADGLASSPPFGLLLRAAVARLLTDRSYRDVSLSARGTPPPPGPPSLTSSPPSSSSRLLRDAANRESTLRTSTSRESARIRASAREPLRENGAAIGALRGAHSFARSLSFGRIRHVRGEEGYASRSPSYSEVLEYSSRYSTATTLTTRSWLRDPSKCATSETLAGRAARCGARALAGNAECRRSRPSCQKADLRHHDGR
ncbi:uncharacterized protein LOC113561747 [Ooceraea biroi]|uniref:uncharacterized protein LOC113561747 n=1 Tax=Ooceraea biroi TaxID=2015173 RepID=UPI000F081FE7|nr:uncharacterized protein LOC113561747 [Ooceraea biroi]